MYLRLTEKCGILWAKSKILTKSVSFFCIISAFPPRGPRKQNSERLFWGDPSWTQGMERCREIGEKLRRIEGNTDPVPGQMQNWNGRFGVLYPHVFSAVTSIRTPQLTPASTPMTTPWWRIYWNNLPGFKEKGYQVSRAPSWHLWVPRPILQLPQGNPAYSRRFLILPKDSKVK